MITAGRVAGLIQAMGGGADPAVIEAKVEEWLDAHPEATTTVQDGSITEQKLATTVAQKLGLISSLSDEIVGAKSAIVDDTSSIYNNGILLVGNIPEKNTRYYALWNAPKNGDVLTMKNVGTINGIVGAIKQDGTFANLFTFVGSTKEGTVTITEQYKSIGFYGYQAGTAKIFVSGAAYNYLKDSILAKTQENVLYEKKVMFFGDSITADENRYRKWLLQNTGMVLVESFAVSGATLTNYDDTVMDGNPTYGNHTNTVPNQVKKLLNGTYTTVPDIVIVSAGTNDYYGKFSTGLVEAQFAVPDSTVSSLAVYTDVDTCDLTTPSGAMRWIYEKIISVYPNTQVYFATPIQRATYPSLFTHLKTKHDTMCAIAERMSCCVIDATYKSGIYSRYENNGASGKYLADGLHPNIDGGKLLAKCYEDEIRTNLHLVEQA